MSSFKQFGEDLYSSFANLFSTLFNKLGIDSDTNADGEVIDTSAPKFFNNSTPVKLTIDYTRTVVYFIITFALVLLSVELGFAPPTVSFMTIAIIYTLITVSLTTHSVFFIALEIIAWSCMIELFHHLKYTSVSWAIVFILPFITIIQSLFYMIFYLQ